MASKALIIQPLPKCPDHGIYRQMGEQKSRAKWETWVDWPDLCPYIKGGRPTDNCGSIQWLSWPIQNSMVNIRPTHHNVVPAEPSVSEQSIILSHNISDWSIIGLMDRSVIPYSLFIKHGSIGMTPFIALEVLYGSVMGSHLFLWSARALMMSCGSALSLGHEIRPIILASKKFIFVVTRLVFL